MEISEIKQRLTIAQVLQHYGLRPDKRGQLRCPFHDDKTPSMHVYYKTQTAYCFSANCGTHGSSLDVIDFIMHKENITKHEAILKAAEMAGLSGDARHEIMKKTETQLTSEQHLITRARFLTNMFTYFKNAVHNSQPSRDYMKTRGLDPTRLEIGYNTGQFHHGTRRDDTLIHNCVSVGLLTPWGTNSRRPDEPAYKTFGRECICFAMRDKANNVTGLYFRSTVNNTDQKHYYLKESTGLYPRYPDPSTERLIIPESIIDTASLEQLETITKQYTLLASYGTNRLNDEIKQAISELKNLKEIIFAFDNDAAGDKAVEKYSNELREAMPGIIISKLELPCKDVNETLIAHQPDVFEHLLEKRVPVLLLNEETEENPAEQEEPTVNQQPSKPQTNQTQNNTTTIPANPLDTRNPHKISYTTATATYHIQGGISKLLDSMKVTIVVEHKETQSKSRNKTDLYEDKQVEKLCKDVSEKLDLRQDLLAADIYKLTDLLDEYREREQDKQTGTDEPSKEKTYPLTTLERTQVETFLKQPNLIHNLNDLLGKAGITGEEKNRIFLLVIATSYKMPETLHALIQGSSGSGKTRLLKQISDCIPQERVTKLTRLSDKVLYNYPEHYFVNRLLCLEDIDGLSEEAEFAFRELQSNGELNSAVSIKLENGTITQGEKKVRGPIASMACTTRGEIYEDNMSRVFLIAVDESQEQTKRIITYQNKKAGGEIDHKREAEVRKFIQNLVREIKPLEVINPFASRIHLPEEAHKIRRLNDLFHNFIKMVTIINQYQRKKTEHGKLITQVEDIETAVEIMFESIVLKVDELDGSLRQFYERLKNHLQKTHKDKNHDATFTQREVRQALHVSKAQINRYLQTLVEMEYLRQDGFANKGFNYKITYWDNHESLRMRIKANMGEQVERLKQEGHEPPVSR